MKKTFGIVVLMFLLAVMSACNNEKPAEEPANAPAIEPEEEKTTEPADEKDSAPNEETEESEDQTSVGTDTVVAGDEVFQKSCITCHSSGDIAGGQGMIDEAKIHTDFSNQEDLLAFVSKNMPKTAPGSLSEEEYEAVVNFLWDQK